MNQCNYRIYCCKDLNESQCKSQHNPQVTVIFINTHHAHIPHNESDQMWRACNRMGFGSLDDEQPTNWALSFASSLGHSNRSVNMKELSILSFRAQLQLTPNIVPTVKFVTMSSVLSVYLASTEWEELFDLSVMKSCNRRELFIHSSMMTIKYNNLFPAAYPHKH